MPSPCAVRITRAAISARLATSSLRIRARSGAEPFGITEPFGIPGPFGITGPDPGLAGTRSHPEDAEAAAPGHGVGVDRRQRQAERGAGVARVDDPVVVEPGGHRERVRLGV